MLPIILISRNSKKTSAFIKDFAKVNKISPNFIFEIRPLVKEFTIGQIRELKKNIVYNFSAPHLYILFDFDSASFEAQNAFLKTLEEHQNTIQFIMVVNNSHKLSDTVVSRSKIINLTKTDEFVSNTELGEILEQFTESPNLKVLSHSKFQAKEISKPADIFKDMALFFRRRLPVDPKSTSVLREILSTSYLVENNNVDPQTGVDHILLYIRKLYR